MKIIKAGTPKARTIWRGTCRDCKSEMEALEGELKVENYQRSDGPFAHVDCPVCGKDVIFYPTDIRKPAEQSPPQ